MMIFYFAFYLSSVLKILKIKRWITNRSYLYPFYYYEQIERPSRDIKQLG